MIKRLAQVVSEDKYARGNIRKEVHKVVVSGTEQQFKPIFDHYVKQVDAWLLLPASYESKQKRKNHLRNINTEAIVIELFIAVLTSEGATPIQAIANKIAVHLDFDYVFDGVCAASELLGVCWDKQLYLVSNDPLVIHPLFVLPKKLRKFIEQTQYMNPMLCKPDKWTNNFNGGYITQKHCVVLGAANRHSEHQALTAINNFQDIEWCLDDHMVNYVEQPKNPLDTQEKVDAWKQHIDTSTRVYQEMMDEGNSFFLPCKNDSRGRIYTQGHYINFQSTVYKKAILNFKKQEVISNEEYT